MKISKIAMETNWNMSKMTRTESYIKMTKALKLAIKKFNLFQNIIIVYKQHWMLIVVQTETEESLVEFGWNSEWQMPEWPD